MNDLIALVLLKNSGRIILINIFIFRLQNNLAKHFFFTITDLAIYFSLEVTKNVIVSYY